MYMYVYKYVYQCTYSRCVPAVIVEVVIAEGSVSIVPTHERVVH